MSNWALGIGKSRDSCICDGRGGDAIAYVKSMSQTPLAFATAAQTYISTT
ncbi:hypothetical protein H6G35_12930 [Aulosira sp. FACHB-113]|nr:hypothetical protein [Aulosira sp. FACHB-113]